MSTPLERARKLIALAASANENEARNAAVEACRLIRFYKLHLSEEQKTSTVPILTADEVVARYGRKRTSGPGRVANMDDLERQPGARRIVDDPSFQRRRRAASEPAFTCDAPMGGTCLDCGRTYHEGDRVWFREGVGAVHAFKCDTEVLYG